MQNVAKQSENKEIKGHLPKNTSLMHGNAGVLDECFPLIDGTLL